MVYLDPASLVKTEASSTSDFQPNGLRHVWVSTVQTRERYAKYTQRLRGNRIRQPSGDPMLVGVRRCEAIVDVHVFVSAGIYVHMDGKGKKRCKRRCKGKCKGKCVCPCKCSGKCACNGNCKCIHKTSNNKKFNTCTQPPMSIGCKHWAQG